MEFLEKYHIIHSYTGLFHTIAAIIAMVFGTMVLLNRKGTTKHKRLGYVYVISMMLMILSSFFIYNFGTFSLFHFFAIISFFTVILGIIPAWRRKKPNWKTSHYYFMNWSVVGLYCAFWAEVGVRFFEMKYFWWVVMLATFITAGIGSMVINREAKKLNLIK